MAHCAPSMVLTPTLTPRTTTSTTRAGLPSDSRYQAGHARIVRQMAPVRYTGMRPNLSDSRPASGTVRIPTPAATATASGPMDLPRPTADDVTKVIDRVLNR